MNYVKEALSDYFVQNFDIEAYFGVKGGSVLSSEERLDEFVKLWTGIKQRDASWYKLMYTTLGGSELASVLDKNKYKKRADVIKDKVLLRLGESVFNGGPACTWGVIFEDILGLCYEQLFNTKIKGDEICIQVYKGHRNSPDGFSVLNLNVDGEIAMDDSNIIGDLITLLEFKCPYSRSPAAIPIHYEVQVQSGLGVSPVADIGLYTDALFKRCTIMQLSGSGFKDNSKYNNVSLDEDLTIKFHNYVRHGRIIKLEKSIKSKLFYGIIGVFASNADNKDMSDVDFGNMGYFEFEMILNKINDKRYNIVRRPLYDINYSEWISDPLFIGVIPWKLYQINITFVERNPRFLEIALPYINSVHEEVDQIYKKEFEIREKTRKHVNTIQSDFIKEFTEDDIREAYADI